MPTIVKVPNNVNADYDYIAFSYKGKHSYEDFGIYRVSDGTDGYNNELVTTLTDKTAEVPGMDGQYYFGTQCKNKVFNINFAFDSLTEEKLQQMKKWLNGKEVGNLWFSEAPHKVYSAKVASNASIKTIVFLEKGQRVYKGTGNIQFTCFYPYARTPDKIVKDGTQHPGVEQESYKVFGDRLYQEIKDTLPGATDASGNPLDGAFGDLPFFFKAILESEVGDMKRTYSITQNGIKKFSITIDIEDSTYTDFWWDSKTGLVTALNSRTGVREIIPYTGAGIGTLEPAPFECTGISSMEYNYLYY